MVFSPRLGYAANHGKVFRAVKRDDCATGGLYTSPTAGQSLDTTKPMVVSWNNQCISPAPELVDVYIYAPGRNESLIQAFSSAKYQDGSMQVALNPVWWGSASTVDLQLSIVAHGTPNFMAHTALGPIFHVAYNSSAPGSTPPPSGDGNGGSIVQKAKEIFHNMSGGAVAAAVLLPLIALGIAIFMYVRYARQKRADKTKRFSRAVDNRMSMISTDWRSLTGSGANNAIRNSMAVNSQYGGRPISTFSTMGGQAGVGSGGIGAIETVEQDVPQMSTLRPVQSTVSAKERASRTISFAPDLRHSTLNPDTDAPPVPSPTGTRAYQTRSFHQAQTPDEYAYDRDLTLSPKQSQGAISLSASDIQARASADDHEFRQQVLQMPAMTLMRTGAGADPNQLGDLVLPPTNMRTAQTAPARAMSPPARVTSPTYPSRALSPTSMNSPAMALTPDDMLRAYAQGRGPASPPAPSTPNSGMRVLYAPPTPQPQVNALDNNPFRKSVVTRSMYTESMYSGVEEEDATAVHQPQQQQTMPHAR